MGEEQRYVDMLIDVLNKQVKTLEEVLEITKRQGMIASAEEFDTDGFDDTLSRKDACIMRLNELDNGFVSVYERVKRQVSEKPDQYKEKIKEMQELIRTCTDLGNEIQTLENRNREKLIKCFSGKKKEYNAKQAAATVAGKYNTTMKNVNIMGEGYRFNQDK